MGYHLFRLLITLHYTTECVSLWADWCHTLDCATLWITQSMCLNGYECIQSIYLQFLFAAIDLFTGWFTLDSFTYRHTKTHNTSSLLNLLARYIVAAAAAPTTKSACDDAICACAACCLPFFYFGILSSFSFPNYDDDAQC